MKILHIAGEHDNQEYDHVENGYTLIEFRNQLFAYPSTYTVDEVQSDHAIGEIEIERTQLANEMIIAAGIKHALRPMIQKWADPRTFRISLDPDENVVMIRAWGLRFTPPGVDRVD